jgi:hypothetical protein
VLIQTVRSRLRSRRDRGHLGRNRWRRASVCSRRAGGRRSVPATRVPLAARKSLAPPPQQRSRGRTRRIRGAYSEPLSATRRGPSDAMAHASRSTNSSTKCARKGENPSVCWGSRSGTRGTRTPDLLGAIQASRTPEIWLVCRVFPVVAVRLRLAVSADFGLFALRSGERSHSLARSRRRPRIYAPASSEDLNLRREALGMPGKVSSSGDARLALRSSRRTEQSWSSWRHAGRCPARSDAGRAPLGGAPGAAPARAVGQRGPARALHARRVVRVGRVSTEGVTDAMPDRRCSPAGRRIALESREYRTVGG